jgi:hypothetical protein
MGEFRKAFQFILEVGAEYPGADSDAYAGQKLGILFKRVWFSYWSRCQTNRLA